MVFCDPPDPPPPTTKYSTVHPEATEKTPELVNVCIVHPSNVLVELPPVALEPSPVLVIAARLRIASHRAGDALAHATHIANIISM
jgi:hypothetical protein